MNTVEAIFTVLGTAVTGLGAFGSLLWWAYRRGESAGSERACRDAARAEDKARIVALEQSVTKTRAEVAALQPRRRRLT
ncbi:MAG: hypothetical protein WAL41_11105 [Mycobacterium sp.]